MLSKEQLEVISKLGDGGYLNYLSDGSFAEMAEELLSLREQYKSQSNELTAMTAAAQALRDEMYKCDAKLDALAALSPVAWRNRFAGYLYSNKPDIVGDFYDELFTAAKLVNVDTIQDELIEQVGVMCDQAASIEEKNVYGHAYCVLKYGILPYLRKQGK